MRENFIPMRNALDRFYRGRLLIMIFEKNEKHKYLLHHAKQFEKRAKENFDHNNLSKIYLLYNIETTTLAQKGSFYWIFK